MGITLEGLSAELKQALSAHRIEDCHEAVCGLIRQALLDDAFVAQHLPDRSEDEHPREVLYEDPELASLIWRGFAQQPRLAPHEWARFSLYLYNVFVLFELSYKKYREGDVRGELFGDTVRAFSWWMSMPGVRAWWNSNPVGFSQDFCVFVDEQIAGIEPATEMSRVAASSFLEAMVAASGSDGRHQPQP